MKKKKRMKWGVLLVVAAAAGFFLIPKAKPSSAAVDQVEVLMTGDVEAFVATSGVVNALDTVDVGSQVSGKIIKLNADFNSRVRAGEVVAELDQEPLRVDIESKKAVYENALAAMEKAHLAVLSAQRKWDRTRDLFAHSLVSLEAREAAEADLSGASLALRMAEKQAAQAKINYDLSQVNLTYAIIRSPIDGTVITRSVNVGQTVAAGFQAPVLFKIATDLTRMQVLCDIDEADIGGIGEGQAARFTVQAFPDDEFEARIRQIRYASTTSANVVTYTAILDVANPELKLRPGMTASVSIITGTAAGVLRVPNGALAYTPAQLPAAASRLAADLKRKAAKGEKVIWMLDDKGRPEPLLVHVGLAGKTYTEVAGAGLKEGLKVIMGKAAAGSMNMFFPGPPMMGGGPPPPPPPGR